MSRRAHSKMIMRAADRSDTAMPTIENSCSGTTENPVIKSKFSRIKL